jgi:arylsulfatase B
MIKFPKITIALFLICITIISFSCKKNTETVDTIITPTPTPTPSASPNVIFIVADDMGWDGFGRLAGANGTKVITPVLDSLATNGITFTNFWVNPECSPTRAAMLTGKYGFRTGVGGVQSPPTALLQSTEKIIHKYINEKTANAYATALIGKWHVTGNTNLSAPESFGMNYFTGFLAGAIPDFSNWTQTSNGAQQNITTYATTHFVNQSVTWIGQQTKPFFLWLALNAPHAPFHRPPLNLISNQNLIDNQATINANPLPYYLASMEAMDKEIGRLISSLTVAQKENTVFVFMGDNGTPTQVIQTPFTATTAKSTLSQGGINTPLIVCGKNVTRRNVVETAMAQAPDMFTTIADITGAGSSNYQDGISLKPLFTNASAPKRTFAYSELFGSTPTTTYDGYAIRNENYKLIKLTSGSEYLYKISTDKFEQTNLMLTTLSTEAQTNLTELRLLKTGL